MKPRRLRYRLFYDKVSSVIIVFPGEKRPVRSQGPVIDYLPEGCP